MGCQAARGEKDLAVLKVEAQQPGQVGAAGSGVIECVGVDAIRDEDAVGAGNSVGLCLVDGACSDGNESVESRQESTDPEALVDRVGVTDVQPVDDA